MKYRLIIFTFFLFPALLPLHSTAQLQISGRVFDSSKLFVIPGVQVFSTSNRKTVTDSLGRYQISVSGKDSIYFFYNGKNSVMYPVDKIEDPSGFDIRMLVPVKNKFKLLKEVRVYSDSYRQDSIENRQQYGGVFDNSGHSIQTSADPVTGAAGLELGSLIQAFQFRKNRQRKSFRQRLIQQEEDSYVDYRFSNQLITRITGLRGKDLEDYKNIYRPSYAFVTNSSLVAFYTYILNTSYAFKAQRGIK